MPTTIFYRKADFQAKSRHDLDESTLDYFIRKLANDFFHKKATRLKAHTPGTYHYLYRILFDSEEYFIKISKFKELRHSLLLENYVYRTILDPLGLGLTIKAFDISCETYPFPFMILRKAEGICLRQVDMNASGFPDIIENLGKVVARYHSLTLPATGFGLIDGEALFQGGQPKGLSSSWLDYFCLNLEDHLHFAYGHKVIDGEERSFIQSVFRECRGLIHTENLPSLLHGDLGTHNVFVDLSTLTIKSIIDWEDALLGDPVFDIAMFASFYRMHEFLDSFLKGYQSFKTIVDDSFDLKFWIYYLRIAITKSVLRVRLGYDRAGESPSIQKIKLARENLKKYMGR